MLSARRRDVDDDGAGAGICTRWHRCSGVHSRQRLHRFGPCIKDQVEPGGILFARRLTAHLRKLGAINQQTRHVSSRSYACSQYIHHLCDACKQQAAVKQGQIALSRCVTSLLSAIGDGNADSAQYCWLVGDRQCA